MTQTEALNLAQKALSNRNAPAKMIYEALHAIKEARAQPEFAIGDIRALRHRIHELEGEVIGYKQILDAQPEQEPVAWMQPDEVHISLWKDDYHIIPLYTTPPQIEVGCAECGVGNHHALYCVACAEKFVGEAATKLQQKQETIEGLNRDYDLLFAEYQLLLKNTRGQK